MQKAHSRFFFLCALEGAVALFFLLRIPGEGGVLSLSRLALLGAILLPAALSLYLGFRPPHGFDRLARAGIIGLSALLSLTFSLLLFLARYLDPEHFLPAYERLSPLLWYLLAVSVQAVLYLLALRYGVDFGALKKRRLVYLSALLAFIILLALFLFVALTRLGITPDPSYWGEPGVAMLGWQFVLALLGGILVLILSNTFRHSVLDVAVPVVIYTIAAAIWLSVPLTVLANGFYAAIDPPDFQPYPYSDAGYYDRTAQSLLVGHSYQDPIPTRPLLIVFLAFLHLLLGDNYPNIIVAQTLVLAGMPVVLYALGTKLHSRVAGATVALFFTFRELTSLMVTSNIRVTNTKLLLADLPTLFLLLLSCLFSLHWLTRRDAKSAIVAGGTFGVLLLLRTQSMLILPIVLLLALLTFGWRNRDLYRQSALFLLALFVAIAPWLARNYTVTGAAVLDKSTQYQLIASKYANPGSFDYKEFDFEGKGLGQIMVEAIVRDPDFVLGFIANHFLAVQVDGLLALPLLKPYQGIFGPVNLYWVTWDGTLEWYNLLLLVFYLAVIAFGLGSAWRRMRWAGLLPLAYNIGYALSAAVGRFSGWRYDYPADWVPYFYFGLGFAEIAFTIAGIFSAKEPTNTPPAPRRDRMPARAYFALFALIGFVPWGAEKIAAPRYENQSLDFLASQITAMEDTPSDAEIEAFAAQPQALVQIGRVLYPRYFISGRGIFSSNPWPVYERRDFPRLGFLLLNGGVTYGVFPSNSIPQAVSHGQDAILLGCQREDYVDVRMIVLPASDRILISAPLSKPCAP